MIFLKDPKVVIALLMGPPWFHFNWELYAQLIREFEQHELVSAPMDDPEVELALGPLDGELGRYDCITHKITIDVLEIFVKIFIEDQTGDKKILKKRFDEEMTRVLAHEGGHWNLERRRGRLPRIEKIALHIGMTVLGGVFFWWLIKPFIELVVTLGSLVSQFNIVAAIATLLILLPLSCFVIYRFTRIFIGGWKLISFMVTYRVCWHERYARSCEEKASVDPRWEDVVIVD